MFIRPCYRRKNGKRHAYWALMESYRTERGPRQRVVAYLGQLDEPQRLGVKDAAEGRQGARQKRLFDDVRPQWVEVDVKRVRVENRRDFGGAWLGLELIDELGLKEFLDHTIPPGREDVSWSLMALVLVLCRLCDPSSELHIVEHFYAQSALPDLLGIPAEKINEQRLYRALDALLPHKEALERFLKNRLGELFGLEYDLLLYDVTSTYFEGQAEANPLARRGYSRDHRPDCKQVCIGLVPLQQLAAVALGMKDGFLQATAVVFDSEEAIRRCFNSQDMVREMIQCFFDEVENLFPQMRTALEKGDLVEVGRLGHRIKGTVVYLGAQPAKEAALRVERFCKCEGGTPSEAEEAINALEHECVTLKAALKSHRLAAEPKQGD